MQNPLSRRFLILVFASFSVAACSNGGPSPSSGGNSSGTSQCAAWVQSQSSSAVMDPLDVQKISLDVDESLDSAPVQLLGNPLDNLYRGRKMGLRRGRLKAGRKLAVVVDRECVAQSNSKKGALVKALQAGGRLRRASPASRFQTLSLRLNSAMLTERLEAMVAEEDCIRGVSNDLEMQMLSATNPNDPFLDRQRHLTAISAAQGWRKFYGNSSGIRQTVVIAVIDGGMQVNHPDLANQIFVNSREVAGNGVDDDGNGYIDDVSGWNFQANTPTPQTGNRTSDYHATHVAGLAAAQSDNGVGVAGVMGQNVRIMPLNVFGSSTNATTADIDEAIRYAADNGAHIINMSLGGPGRADTTGSAMAYAVNKGVTIIIAAGNSSMDLTQSFFTPASYAESIAGALAVGSVDTTSASMSGFSNYSSAAVEISAPGSSGVYSTITTSAYGNEQGTSMASPVVAAAAGLASGLIWSRAGARPSPAVIESLLMSSADKQSNLASRFRNGNFLNLASLADAVDQAFPASGGGTGVPIDCP